MYYYSENDKRKRKKTQKKILSDSNLLKKKSLRSKIKSNIKKEVEKKNLIANILNKTKTIKYPYKKSIISTLIDKNLNSDVIELILHHLPKYNKFINNLSECLNDTNNLINKIIKEDNDKIYQNDEEILDITPLQNKLIIFINLIKEKKIINKKEILNILNLLKKIDDSFDIIIDHATDGNEFEGPIRNGLEDVILEIDNFNLNEKYKNLYEEYNT